MNLFTFLYFFSFIVYIEIGIYAYYINRKSLLNRLFLILSLIFSLWALDNVVMHSVSSLSFIWVSHKFFAVSWCVYAGVILHFFIVLTGHQKWLKKWWIYFIMYLPGVVFFAATILGKKIIIDFTAYEYGWKAVYNYRSAFYWLYNLYFISYIIFSLSLTIHWYMNTSDEKAKQQSRIIIVATIFSLTPSLIVDVIFPMFNIAFPSAMAMIFILIWMFGIGYSMVKYDLMSLQDAKIALEESEIKFLNLVDNISAAILIHKGRNFLFANRTAEMLLGYSREELYHKNIIDFVHNDSKPIVLQNAKGRLDGFAPTTHYEIKAVNKNREILWLDITVVTILYEGDYAALVVAFDITGIKKREIELKNLILAVQQSSSMILILDKEGKIEFANQRFTSITGYSQEESKGLDILLALNGGSSSDEQNILQLLIDGKERKGEWIVKKKNGEPFWVYYTFTPVKNKEGEIIDIIGVADDITLKKRVDEESQKISKMESISILAGGIGHDLNNILTAIMGNISLAKLYVKNEDPIWNFINEAEKASFRARELGWQFLGISKSGELFKKQVSVNELLKDTVAHSLAIDHYRTNLILPDNLWKISADEGLLCQVLDILISNAKQSLSIERISRMEDWDIEIECSNWLIDHEKEYLPVSEGKYIKISIKDKGEGISSENIKKIFDPYFTTRTKGLGLGLTMAYWIVKKHQGHIAVKSEIGKGSEFTIYLPVSETAGNE